MHERVGRSVEGEAAGDERAVAAARFVEGFLELAAGERAILRAEEDGSGDGFAGFDVVGFGVQAGAANQGNDARDRDVLAANGETAATELLDHLVDVAGGVGRLTTDDRRRTTGSVVIQRIWVEGGGLDGFDGEGAGDADGGAIDFGLVVEGFGFGRLVLGDAFERDVRNGFIVERALDALFGVGEPVHWEGGCHEPLASEREGHARGIAGDPAPAPVFRNVGAGAAAAGWIEHHIAGVCDGVGFGAGRAARSPF